jgi:hypothetical protein
MQTKAAMYRRRDAMYFIDLNLLPYRMHARRPPAEHAGRRIAPAVGPE